MQISINGSTDGDLRYSYELAKLYERNLEYIKED